MLRVRDLTSPEIAERDSIATNAASSTNKMSQRSTNTKSANGRDRGDFYAYQREYMRKRRAAKTSD